MPSRKAESDILPRNVMYWLLIAVCIYIIYRIIDSIIKKILFS
ncbi:MAG TPA: hypothetical protein VJB12_04165 [Candidatus Nanoarchaeia archaeon]|nr:hypothetical protein [Candidatus Nanoarchaeia archaeon]